MTLYDPNSPTRSDAHSRVHAVYELIHTAVDFTAAALFVIGSILFFYESTTFLGTWLFLIGSVCFALKPTIKLLRELKYWRMGRIDELAARQEAE
ncbi:MAG: YrhK family protein [Pseudomonadota bacterium]